MRVTPSLLLLSSPDSATTRDIESMTTTRGGLGSSAIVFTISHSVATKPWPRSCASAGTLTMSTSRRFNASRVAPRPIAR